MNGFKQYITSFFSGLRSLLVGMRTTLRVFFRKKTTEQYPENRDTLKMFDRFRGQLVMKHNDRNEHRCVACGICQMNCPNDSIRVVSETVEDEQGKKKKVLVRYEYDLGSCLSASSACAAARTTRSSSTPLSSMRFSRAASWFGSSIRKVQLLKKNRRTWKLPYNRPVSPFSPR